MFKCVIAYYATMTKAILETRVHRWGGSLGLVVPHTIVGILELKPDDIVIVNIEKVK